MMISSTRLQEKIPIEDFLLQLGDKRSWQQFEILDDSAKFTTERRTSYPCVVGVVAMAFFSGIAYKLARPYSSIALGILACFFLLKTRYNKPIVTEAYTVQLSSIDRIQKEVLPRLKELFNKICETIASDFGKEAALFTVGEYGTALNKLTEIQKAAFESVLPSSNRCDQFFITAALSISWISSNDVVPEKYCEEFVDTMKDVIKAAQCFTHGYVGYRYEIMKPYMEIQYSLFTKRWVVQCWDREEQIPNLKQN